jgi:hypothetical protein
MTEIFMNAIVMCCGLAKTTEGFGFSENVLILLDFVISHNIRHKYQEELIQCCLKTTLLVTKKKGNGCSYLFTFLFTYLITYIHIYLLTYLLTPWSRVFLEKLTGLQLVNNFTSFYGTRMFITAFTTAHHLSLSLA